MVNAYDSQALHLLWKTAGGALLFYRGALIEKENVIR